MCCKQLLRAFSDVSELCVCCSVLQCVAVCVAESCRHVLGVLVDMSELCVCCSVVQCVLQYVVAYRSVLLFVAACCGVLQCIAVCCGVMQISFGDTRVHVCGMAHGYETNDPCVDAMSHMRSMTPSYMPLIHRCHQTNGACIGLCLWEL